MELNSLEHTSHVQQAFGGSLVSLFEELRRDDYVHSVVPVKLGPDQGGRGNHSGLPRSSRQLPQLLLLLLCQGDAVLGHSELGLIQFHASVL